MKIDKKMLQKLAAMNLMEGVKLSDIIVKISKKHSTEDMLASEFLNLASGNSDESFEKITRKGHKFIYLNTLHKNCGFIAKHIKEFDILLISLYIMEPVTMRFNNVEDKREDDYKWREDSKIIIFKEKTETHEFLGNAEEIWKHYKYNCYVLFEDGTMRGLSKIDSYMFYESVDLCGQLVYSSYNCYGNSWDEVKKFYEIPLVTRTKERIFTMQNFLDTVDNSTRISLYHPVGELKIPKEIKDAISRCAKRCFRAVYPPNETFLFTKGMRFGYLQNVDGTYFLREAYAYINGWTGDDKNTAPIGFSEISTTMINKAVLSYMEDVDAPLVYYDKNGIEDSPLKYVQEHLDAAVMKNREQLAQLGKYILCLNENAGNLCLACAMAFCPFVEKMYKVLGRVERAYLKEYLSSHHGSLNGLLQHLMGKINLKEQEVHKVIGVSKPVFKVLAENERLFIFIKDFKDIFYYDKKYLNTMDEKTAKKVYDFLFTYGMSYYGVESRTTLKHIVKLFGGSGIKSYIDFVLKNAQTGDGGVSAGRFFSTYRDYLEKVEVLKDNVAGLEWNLSGEALERTNASLYEAYMIAADETIYKECLECFKKHKNVWSKYEYGSGEFLVTYPKRPSELVNEGVKLNHCVKEYINKVKRDETRIFFIRRKSNPDKPFYTLEIMENNVRQCHGANNCNIDECDGLKEFLERYCKEKGITVDWININRALGV